MDTEVIAALGTVIAQLTGLIVAVTLLWRKAAATEKLVNNKSDEQAVRLGQLTTALVASGTPVPDDPAIDAAARRVEQEKAP